MQIEELQQWIKENLFKKNGHLNGSKLRKNGIKIKKINVTVYENIINKTKFLNHINPSLNQRIYHIINDIFYIIKCKECSKPVNFKKYNSGYNIFCNNKCAGNNLQVRNKTKQTCLENHGVEHPSQVPEIKEKARETYKETCLENHGVENPMQVPEIKEKVKETKLRNHGDENYNNIEKYKETCLENHGVEHPSQVPEIREKAKQTCLEKYDDENYNNRKKWIETYKNKTDEEKLKIKEKYKQTCLENHGVDYPLQVPEIREQAKQTCLENHGVEYPLQSEEIKEKTKEKYKQTCLDKHGVEHHMQVPEIAEKISGFKNSYHDYQLPSGKWIKLQGYEPYALDNLLEIYNEEEILYKKIDVPGIWYIGEDNKKHRYYPDFYIPKDNLVIEVKSTFTYNKELNKNLLKEEATKDLNYNYDLVIFNDKKEIL